MLRHQTLPPAQYHHPTPILTPTRINLETPVAARKVSNLERGNSARGLDDQEDYQMADTSVSAQGLALQETTTPASKRPLSDQVEIGTGAACRLEDQPRQSVEEEEVESYLQPSKKINSTETTEAFDESVINHRTVQPEQTWLSKLKKI